MLWYKAWLETRTRFAIALALLIALCAELVFVVNKLDGKQNAMKTLSGVHVTLVGVWSLAVVFLTMGGLLRESANGSAQFTLALPVSRTRLVLTQIGMALIESIVLGAAPWFAMLLAAKVADRGQFLSQAALHVLLLLTGGIVFLSVSLLFASSIESEYVAPVVAFGAIVVLAYGMSGRSLARYNPWAYMTGYPFLDRHSGLLTGPFPLFQAGAYVAVAIVLLGFSIRAIQRRDF